MFKLSNLIRQPKPIPNLKESWCGGMTICPPPYEEIPGLLEAMRNAEQERQFKQNVRELSDRLAETIHQLR